MLLKSLNKKSALIDQKSFISNSSFIKIGSLLSPIKLSKYFLTIFIYSIKNLKSADTAKMIFGDLHYIIRANVLLKLMPSI